MRKNGLVSISFRSLTPEEIVKYVKENGLSYIEWGSDVHAKPDNKERLSEIAELCRKNGIGISSYGTYFNVLDNAEDIEKYFDASDILGTDIVRIWAGNKKYEDCTESEFNAVIEGCRRAAKAAEKRGKTVCTECHVRTLTHTPQGAMKMLGSVGSENFRMYWQPIQALTLEENIEYARLAAPYTKIIHTFNWDREARRYPLGDAIDIWKKYLSFFDEKIPSLLEFMPDDNPESLKKETESLSEILR